MNWIFLSLIWGYRIAVLTRIKSDREMSHTRGVPVLLVVAYAGREFSGYRDVDHSTRFHYYVGQLKQVIL